MKLDKRGLRDYFAALIDVIMTTYLVYGADDESPELVEIIA